MLDPRGFVAPVVLEGRLILREIISRGLDWDESLPQDILVKWLSWRDQLKDLGSRFRFRLRSADVVVKVHLLRWKE